MRHFNKRVFYILGALALFTLSCENKNKYVLPKDRFEDVLVDLHLAEAFYSNNQFGELKLMELDSGIYYQTIFKKHNIDRAVFDSTLKTYTIQPEVIEAIYDNVIEKLKKMEADLDKLEEEMLNKEESKLE